MRARTILVIIMLLATVFFITSCGKEPECEANADCATGNPCFAGKCLEGTCTRTPISGCCGNNQCETGENKCTCDKDCGKCEGIYKYNTTTNYGRQVVVTTKYLSLFCENDRCKTGILPDRINSIQLINDIIETGGFKAELLSTINDPFIVGTDTLSIRLLLKDKYPLLVSNVSFSRIQVLEGSEVLGEKMITRQLGKIGDMWTEQIKLVSSQVSVEEAKSIDIKLDYSYTVLERNGTDPKTRQATYTRAGRISSMKSRLAEKITFVVIPELE